MSYAAAVAAICFVAVVAPARAGAFEAADGTRHECSAGPRDGGRPVTVKDFFSDDPWFLATGYTAFATYDAQGSPIVHLNEARIAALAPLAQKFIFYHECAHLWTRDDSDTRELSANCAALRHMRRNGIVTQADAGELKKFVRGLPESLPLYPDGKIQWDEMKDCR